ncbi:hypothetical protein BDR26DRAFT_861947, partial [Obelidium mucronatum]
MGDTKKRKKHFVDASEKLRRKAVEEKKTHTDDKLIRYDKVILEPWKHKDSFSSYPRITYFNGHRGCNENLHAVLSRLGLNFNIVNPRNLTRYGMREIDAQELIDSGYISALCNLSDVIVIADTVPDARGILLSLVDPNPALRCNSNIIVEMTNRYDWMVGDIKEYHEMLVKLIENPPANLFWTANNPFEKEFMHARIGIAPKVKLLRSLGAWDVGSSLHSPPSIEDSFAILTNPDILNRPRVGDLIKYYCMPVVSLPKKYGGPAGLLKYKGFIEFPYQVSVMKFYENIAFGVPQVLPTPRFLRLLVLSNNHHYFSTWLDKLESVALFQTDPEKYRAIEAEKQQKEEERKKKEERRGALKPTIVKQKMNQSLPTNKSFESTTHPQLGRRAAVHDRPQPKRKLNPLLKLDNGPYNATWTEMADFYSKEFSPFVYYFDSFKELTELINTPLDKFDTKNVRLEGPKYYARVREESMKTWIRMLHDMGYTHLRDLTV